MSFTLILVWGGIHLIADILYLSHSRPLAVVGTCICSILCVIVADLLALVCGVFCEFVTFPLVSWVRCGT